MVRILVLATSYPSVAAPSGAPYLTSRLATLTARPEVSVQALALVPRYGPVSSAARRRLGLLPNEALRLPDNDAGRRYQGLAVRWRLADVAAGRLGRIPMALIARASAGVLATIGVPPLGMRRFDVVHAHGMYTLPAGAVAERVAAALEIPFVVSMHGSDVQDIMPRRARGYREVLSRAGATTYVSAALRDQAVALGAPTARSHVISNGVDLDVFAPEQGSRQDHPKPAAGEPARVLFAGNLLSVKGVDRLPDIMRALRARLPAATLEVAGDGPLRDVLEAETVEGVRCHGRVEPARVAELMRAASVVLVPSRAEGWGCVISEAYATGTPVVGSAVGGIPEALAGFSEPVPLEGDDATIADAFAQRIVDVLAAPPDPAALIAAVAGQDWDAVVDAELSVLTEVVRSAG